MNQEQRAALRKLAEEATPGPWEIRWYECKADRSDVKAGSAKKVGDVLWRVPKVIGMMAPGENHWAGDYIDAPDEDIYYITAANPSTILQLLDYIETLEGALQNAKDTFECLCGENSTERLMCNDAVRVIDSVMQGETE